MKEANSSMPYITYHSLRISRLTLGTVQLGMSYGIANKTGEPDTREAGNLLGAAVDAGVTCYDTALSYGRSQSVLGAFFSTDGAGREQAVFVSKVKAIMEAGITEADIERQFTEQLEAILAELQLKTLPILLLHDPEVLAECGEAVARVLRKLHGRGYFAAAGISFDGHADIQYARLRRWVEDDLYEAIQLPINPLDVRMIRNGALSAFRASGKLVFARSVFLQGLLFLAQEELPPGISAAGEWIDLLKDCADREGISVAQLAVSFVRDLEGIGSLVIGAERTEQLKQNMDLLEGPPIGEETRERLLRDCAGVPVKIVNPQLWREK